MSALASALPADLPITGFSRLRALIAQGYRAHFSEPETQPACFRLTHVAGNRDQRVSPLFLWGDGLLMAQHILWPEQYVPSDRVPPPDWQKHIAADDDATFSRFIATVKPPSQIDLHVRPAWKHMQIFAFKLLFGSSLCITIAGLVVAMKAICQ